MKNLVNWLARSKGMANWMFSVVLYAIQIAFTGATSGSAEFREKIKGKNVAVQIKLKDNSRGRYYTFKDGKVSSKSGIHPKPDVAVIFDNAAIGLEMFVPPRNQVAIISAQKNFQIGIQGPDELCSWFTETASMMLNTGLRYGIKMPGGVMKYTSNTNGGPIFVYVKDDKIIRIVPMDFAKDDAPPWTIKARGKEFTPPHKATIAPYGQAWKSLVYSPDRILYPMKRVDFDPKGNRNPQNRGLSGYERISWDEALDLVASEIKRMKTVYGPGAILNGSGSHHTWGNIGYWLSSRLRFMNNIGFTPVHHNPDSWEGWYWGAMHHWGQSMRLGGPDTYGTVEDCLKDCDMVVFWSSDPEATNGAYNAFEGTVRRQWLKDVGIKLVHIDPFFNHTAALFGGKWLAPRPATGNALALAIAYVWITEGLYDKDYVAKRTTGFEQWRDYILGKEDGVPKTPEWQEGESAIPAREVRALAREWGTKRTYLSPGSMPGVGGACRCATGNEWARSMVLLMAMQGMGKPGVNWGAMQGGTPIDVSFYFPGYADGGISGDLQNTALGANLYPRFPQLPTINTVRQRVPRLNIPEAILDGHTSGYPTDTMTNEAQFFPYEYPAPGYSPIHMYYKYGGSHIGTMVDTNRYVKAYRSSNLEFVVNQSIWFEGEAKYADVLLPACTSFERWDIGESANPGGYAANLMIGLNHRVIVLQHPCIKPLGESKSDYQIFNELAKKLGFSAMFSEGMSELDWCKRLYDATDLPKVISWKKLLKKGYYVVPAPPENMRHATSFRWYAEDRLKDIPEIAPLPSDYSEQVFKGMQTQSGKIEFASSSLKRLDPNDPERPVISKYIPSWEGHHTKELYGKYPLQLISPHPRYTFHTTGDAKKAWISDIDDHRIEIDGYRYWILRINPKDAQARGIKHKDLVRIFNDRGSVLCAAQVTHRVPPGTLHSYEGAASYEPIGEHGSSTDRGGCINLLTPSRPIIKRSSSMAANSCLVQVEKYTDKVPAK